MTIVVLSLDGAAKLLGMKPAALRIKAKTGKIPGAKPGKEWVFIEQDIIDYIRGLYLSGKEQLTRDKSWQQKVKSSSREETSGGTGSRIQELKSRNAAAQKQALSRTLNAS
jgi:hypothetical protein